MYRDMLQMYPAEAQKRRAHSWGTLLCSRIQAKKGSEWTAARRLMGGMPPTLTTSCAVT